MSYAQKIAKKRLLGEDNRRASGAVLLRDELNNETGKTSSLLDDIPPFQQNKGVLMANFEEWIKMATDNKINTTNSWNFALIDYFHDMNVLREKDNNINFQKASATLDGCVKIYSSRIDSVATETGRLLSGLATRKEEESADEERGEENSGNEDDDDEDDDLDDDDELEHNHGSAKPTKSAKTKKDKQSKKNSTNTLATFASLKLKKLSQEWSIDPLFKKTLAEFDEGGAKSLLLNTLHMDNHSKVVFDAATDPGNSVDNNDQDDDEVPADVDMSGISEEDIDIEVFKSMIFENEQDLDSKTVCPSIEHLLSVVKDVKHAKSILNDVQKERSLELPANNIQAADDVLNQDDDIPDFDFGPVESSFGDMEEEAANVLFNDDNQVEAINDEHKDLNEGVITSVVDRDLMAYFDNTMKRNWAGPDHWKVKQLKREIIQQGSVLDDDNNIKKAKKPKQVFEINFLEIINDGDSENEESEEERIFAKSKASTTIPPDQRQTKDSNLLPDDTYFSSSQLIKLFLKPEQKINIFQRKVVNKPATVVKNETTELKDPDATFWADNYEKQNTINSINDDFFDAGNDSFDLGFGAGDNYDHVFADLKPKSNGEDDDGDENKNFGTHLITGGKKVKSEQLNYSKKAKNVDVKVLKDNMWSVLDKKKHNKDIKSLKLSDITNEIAALYPTDQRKELSTSFCFICLLHLANEHGLTLNNCDKLEDLTIELSC